MACISVLYNELINQPISLANNVFGADKLSGQGLVDFMALF
jgi:hypothetical protein